MMNLKLNNADWEILKIKLKRKYSHLQDEDLLFVEGNEVQLIESLAKRLRRSKDYIVFTISKQLADLSNNRL